MKTDSDTLLLHIHSIILAIVDEDGTIVYYRLYNGLWVNDGQEIRHIAD
jgi:hypothetical protein